MSTRFLLAALAALSLLSAPLAASASTTISHEGSVNTQSNQSLDDYDHPSWNGSDLPPIDYMGN